MHKILHTKNKRNIAYQHYKGKSSIGIIFFQDLNLICMEVKHNISLIGAKKKV